MAERELVVASDADALAVDVAARTADLLARVQQDGGRVRVALTAGSIMEKVWARLAETAADAVDWSRVDVFWGDERFVPAGSDDRNDAPAERLLFGAAPFSAALRYSMPTSDGDLGDDLDAAAAAYALELGSTPMDLVLLGVGPDGHCCSLFPDHPGLQSDDVIVAVRNSPKPPPNRLSFSFDTLNASDEIWVVASGSGKAEAAAKALADGADPEHVPVSGAQACNRTVWFLDEDAAAQLA